MAPCSLLVMLCLPLAAIVSGAIIDREAILAAHKAARDEIGGDDMKALVWDNALAAAADAYAATCASGHDPDNAGNGENLAWATTLSGAGACQMWAEEKSNFDMASKSCPSGADCGHYQQMIWAATSRIGCAMSDCTSGALYGNHQMWVCRYNPPGNVVGQSAYGGGGKGGGGGGYSQPKKAASTGRSADGASYHHSNINQQNGAVDKDDVSDAAAPLVQNGPPQLPTTSHKITPSSPVKPKLPPPSPVDSQLPPPSPVDPPLPGPSSVDKNLPVPSPKRAASSAGKPASNSGSNQTTPAAALPAPATKTTSSTSSRNMAPAPVPRKDTMIIGGPGGVVITT